MITLLVMAFAVSGGLYLGTIAFSAFKFAEFDAAILQATEFLKIA